MNSAYPESSVPSIGSPLRNVSDGEDGLSVIVGEDESVTMLGVDSSDEPSLIGKGRGRGPEPASRV